MDRAEEMFQDALSVSQRIGDARGIGLVVHALGNVYELQQDAPSAMLFFAQAHLALSRWTFAGAGRASHKLVELCDSVEAAGAHLERLVQES